MHSLQISPFLSYLFYSVPSTEFVRHTGSHLFKKVFPQPFKLICILFENNLIILYSPSLLIHVSFGAMYPLAH